MKSSIYKIGLYFPVFQVSNQREETMAGVTHMSMISLNINLLIQRLKAIPCNSKEEDVIVFQNVFRKSSDKQPTSTSICERVDSVDIFTRIRDVDYHGLYWWISGIKDKGDQFQFTSAMAPKFLMQ